MHRFLAAFLGVLAFLSVCFYWLWQMAAGEPALPIEDVALRATLAMIAIWALGMILGRLGVALVGEAWHESQSRLAEKNRSPAESAEGGAPAGTGREENR